MGAPRNPSKPPLHKGRNYTQTLIEKGNYSYASDPAWTHWIRGASLNVCSMGDFEQRATVWSRRTRIESRQPIPKIMAG